MANTALKQVSGDCDCCSNVNVVITMRNRMMMCADCIAKEDAVVPTIQSADALIEASGKLDQTVKLETDLFNSIKVAAIELKAAIDNDASIPEDQKNYIMAQVTLKRYQHMKEVVFNDHQTLNAHQNEMKAWQVQVQEFAGKLRADLRAQFKTMDISYSPVTPKTPSNKSTKSTKTTTSARPKATSKEVIEAAKKYGVIPSLVAMVCDTRKLNAEAAAKFIAEQSK